MNVIFEDLLSAYEFVSSAPYGEHTAILRKDSGKILFDSEISGEHEATEDDINAPDAVAIPHKNDLDMGRDLVFAFVRSQLPGDYDRVREIFKKRGAYGRFKDLLDRRGLLQAWYDFEAQEQKAALRRWCAENGIDTDDGRPSG